MATPQYRPIDAPDFSGAMRGYQMFSDQLNNAFAAARGTLSDLQTRQTQAADQEVLARALQQQDAGGFRDALANGSLLSGVNPNRLSVGVLTGLQDRVGTLLGQDRTRQQLEQGALGLESDRYNFGRTQDANQRADAARSAQAALYDAAARGDTAAVNRIRTENASVLGNLNADQALATAQGQQGLLSGEQRQRVGEFGLSRDQYNLGITQRDDRESRSARTLATEVLRNAANSEDARSYLEGLTNIDPNIRAMASSLVQSAFPGTYGPSAAPAVGGGQPSAPGAAGTQRGNVYDTTYQFRPTAQPITQTKIGDVLNQQADMIRTQGASPLGAFQINKATLEDFAPKVLGSNWRDQNFDAEAQNKIGEAIFNARKNGDLTQTWAALRNTQPGAYKNKTWAEVRQEISQAETGQNVGLFDTQQGATNSSLRNVMTRSMQDNSTGIAPDFGQTIADTSSVAQVADRLVGEEGSFRGTNRGVIVNELNKIVNSRGGINAATAGAILERNIAQADDDGGLPSLLRQRRFLMGVLTGNPDSPNLGNGIRLNTKGISASVENFRSGGLRTELERNQQQTNAATAIAGAQQRYEEAQAAYAAQVARAQTQPGLIQTLPRYKERLDAARARLDLVRNAQDSITELNPQFDVTQPEPLAQSRGGGSNGTTEILRQAAGPLPSGVPAPGFRGQGRNW